MSDLDLPAELVDEPAWANELDEAIVAGGELPDVVQRWQVDNLDAAEWAMRKLAALHTRMAEVKQQAQVWRTRIDAWEHDELQRVLPPASFFGEHLRRYAILRRHDDPKAKTLHLPSGVVSTRATATAVVVDDEAKVMEWVVENCSEDDIARIIKVTRSVLVSELRKHVEVDQGQVFDPETGEVVPGVSVRPATISAHVEPSL